MVNKLKVVIFCAVFHRLLELKREISSQTDIAPTDLIIVNQNTSSTSETETVGRVFPTTSLEFPVVITSVSVAVWRGVTRIKPTLREFTDQ